MLEIILTVLKFAGIGVGVLLAIVLCLLIGMVKHGAMRVNWKLDNWLSSNWMTWELQASMMMKLLKLFSKKY